MLSLKISFACLLSDVGATKDRVASRFRGARESGAQDADRCSDGKRQPDQVKLLQHADRDLDLGPQVTFRASRQVRLAVGRAAAGAAELLPAGWL
jgi:hypothetical protein